jgi:ribonuclease HI
MEFSTCVEEMKSFEIYSDASYNQFEKYGVFGFHFYYEEKLISEFYSEKIFKTNTQLELEGIVEALKAAGNYDGNKVLYCDCQKAFQTNTTREDLKKFLVEIQDLTKKQNIKMEKVVGHSRHKKLPEELRFSILDKAIRRHLRALVKNKVIK